jgi:photosystem II stability/assembly factor-like uncharacterized protein
LIESTDGGATWTTMSLSGAADFHGLRAAHGALYGYNSTDGTFMVSTDRRTWQTRSRTTLGAFAVDPTNAGGVLAVGRDGLQRSTDGGRTWQPVPGGPPLAVLTWDTPTRLWGVDGNGTVWRSADGGTSWQQRGQVPGEPHAITTSTSTLYAAVTGDEIFASTDGAQRGPAGTHCPDREFVEVDQSAPRGLHRSGAECERDQLQARRIRGLSTMPDPD